MFNLLVFISLFWWAESNCWNISIMLNSLIPGTTSIDIHLTETWWHQYFKKIDSAKLSICFTLALHYFANVIMIEQNSVFKLIKGIWIKELKFSITTGRTLKIVHERNLWSWSTSPCWLSLQLHLDFSSKIKIFRVIGNSSDRVYIT